MAKKPTSMASILGGAKAKTAAKKKPAPKAKKVAMMDAPVGGYKENKSVRITQADNGLTVSSYGPKGEELRVARSHGEAMRHVKDMLGKDKC